jgi:hypothetical protein
MKAKRIAFWNRNRTEHEVTAVNKDKSGLGCCAKVYVYVDGESVRATWPKTKSRTHVKFNDGREMDLEISNVAILNMAGLYTVSQVADDMCAALC